MTAIAFTSCDVEVDDGKYADDVVGTYIINAVDASAAGYDIVLGDEIVITKINDVQVDVVMDFSSELVGDLTLNNVILSSGSGDDIDLDKEYSNAVVIGYVNGDDLKLRVDYTDDESFIDFEASK